MTRSPAVAGQFYDGTERGCLRQIEASYRHKVGPGSLPPAPGKWPVGKPWAYIVPHAGYVFSGPVAAHAFLDIARRGVPETVIILGPSHHPISHDLAVSAEGWRTPLGVAECDDALARQLVGGRVALCNEDFALEHSLEVEVPFVQHLSRDVKIAPLIMLDQSLEAARAVGRRLAQVLAANPGKSVGVLASTDFTHYEAPSRAAAQDAHALAAIAKGSAEELARAVEEHDISMCGPGPTMALLEALRPKETALLKYANSADAQVVRPMPEVVAYASIRVA
jgi:AmmeMemoRadiSam system protein B